MSKLWKIKVISDKISKTLEKQLKVLGQQIRIDILKKLDNLDNPLSFTMLQKEVLGTNPSSVNFTFHLKTLKTINYITSSADGYSITSLGKRMLKNIILMEQIINDENKTIMIRTSKYSKEPFNIENVEQYLMKEGDINKSLAKRIALEVQERLYKANIEYLTTPLIREYVNAILLENGLEEIRHKLTRLGTPPFEALKLFNNSKINPEEFLEKLGYDVSEQFLLLNLLPKDLADMYLSGEIALLNLSYWSLRPLSIYLNHESILDIISKESSIVSSSLVNREENINFILNLMNLLMRFKPFFSEDLILGEFNNLLLFLFNSLKQKDHTFLFDILTSQILRYNELFYDKKSHLTLEFNNTNDKDSNNINTKFLKEFGNRMSSNNASINPLILFDYSNLDSLNPILNENKDLISTLPIKDMIFYSDSPSNLINSTIVKVTRPNNHNLLENRIVLDKILINLHLVALQANQNDDIFYDILQDRLNATFELFDHKESLTEKKLKSNKTWENLTLKLFNNKKNNWLEESVRSISFFGLNEAIKTHCGIELDRIERSQSFALRIIKLLKKLIMEKNEARNNSYNLSQPHKDIYLSHRYSSRIIRKEANRSLESKISLFKKFAKIIDGGIIFKGFKNLKTHDIWKNLELLKGTKLPAFSLNA